MRAKPQRRPPDLSWAPIALSRCLARLGGEQQPPASRLTASVSALQSNLK